MSASNDGGPAFPGAYTVYPHKGPVEGVVVAEGGMSLRDWIAGQALSGWLSDPSATASPEDTAERIYQYADAMLAERAKGGRQ